MHDSDFADEFVMLVGAGTQLLVKVSVAMLLSTSHQHAFAPACTASNSAASYLKKAMRENGMPVKIVMDKSGGNKIAINDIYRALAVPITFRQAKHQNLVEQDHRAIKSVTGLTLGLNYSWRGQRARWRR